MQEALSLVIPITVVVVIATTLYMIPVRLWIEALSAGVSVGIGTLIGMRLRKVSPAAIVRPLINATKAGLDLDIVDLEAHYLAAVLGVKLATGDLALSGIILIAHHARDVVPSHQSARLEEQDCIIIFAD